MPLTKRKRQLQQARDSKRSRGPVEKPRDKDVKQESAGMKQEEQSSEEQRAVEPPSRRVKLKGADTVKLEDVDAMKNEKPDALKKEESSDEEDEGEDDKPYIPIGQRPKGHWMHGFHSDGEEDSDAGFPDTDEESESEFEFTDDERTNWGGPDALDRARDKWLAEHPDPEDSETRQDQAAEDEWNPGPEETARIVKAVKESGLLGECPFPGLSSEADEATEVQSVKDEGQNALVPNAPVPDAPVPSAPTPKAPVRNAFDSLMKAARERPRQKGPAAKPAAKGRATPKKK